MMVKERVLRRAACYATNRYHNTSSVNDMLENLNNETLETRRSKSQLTMMYKIMHGLVNIPAEDYLTSASTRTRALLTKKLRQYASSTDALKYSYFHIILPVFLQDWDFLGSLVTPCLKICGSLIHLEGQNFFLYQFTIS